MEWGEQHIQEVPSTMRQLIAALIGIVSAWGCAEAAPVSFQASDGGTVYANATPAEGTAKGTIPDGQR